MTEDEAKTKWCPHAIASHTNPRQRHYLDSDGGSTEPTGPFIFNCLGNQCSQWRWHEPKRTAAFLEAVSAHMRTQSKPNFNASVQAVYAETGGQFERIEGFCGLAGAAS